MTSTTTHLLRALLTALLLLTSTSSAQDPAHSSGWIVIPVGEYGSLHAKAYPPMEREPDGPPLDATLTRVEYDLRIEGDLASGRAILTIDVLKDGWASVPIPSGLLIREARLDGKLVSLAPLTPAGAMTETVEVTASGDRRASDQIGRDVKKNAAAADQAASSNVLNLQKRIAGVLPIRVDVPRAGNSFRFVRPLVLDEETKVTFSYRTK